MHWYPSWRLRILPILVLSLLTVAAFAQVSEGETVASTAASDSIGAITSGAAAADSAHVQGLSWLGICFDLNSQSRMLAVHPGETFHFYLVAHGAEGGIRAWEAKLLIDERIAVLDRQADGIDVDPGKDSWRVGLGKDCALGQDIVLATYTAHLKNDEDEDLVLGIAPVDHGSFHPPSPGYLSCLSIDDKRPLAYADTTAVVNPVHVQLEKLEQGEPSPHFQMLQKSHGR